MQQVFHLKGADGEDYDVPNSELENFRKAMPDAVGVGSYRGKDGSEYDVPDSERENFQSAVPDAQPTRRLSFADGSTRDFTMPELSKFLRSKEWREDEKYAADREDARQRNEAAHKEAGAQGGFWSELGRRMFTAEGIRENAQDSALAKPYAYVNDLANSLVSGLLGAGSKITEGAGHAIGDNSVGRALVDEGRAGQQTLQRTLPTDALDTSGGGVVNEVLQTGKNVAAATGEFAPAAIPGVGQAYAASIVGAGSVNRAAEVYDAATANGMSPMEANSLAMGAGAVDAVQNMLLMGAFKGIWKGAEKNAADAVKRSLVKKLTVDTLRTGGIMGAGAAAQDVVNQAAGIDEKGKVAAPEEYSFWRTAKAGLDGFLEGGMFHLVNTAAHALPKAVAWQADTKTMSAQQARDALDTPEGRALVMSNSPEATKRILEARAQGKDVSRKMLESLGIPSEVAQSKADRNALADAMAEDYRQYKKMQEAWQKKMPDEVQSKALDEAIAEIGVEGETAKLIREEVLKNIDDAKDLDDPQRREELVDEAIKDMKAEPQSRVELPEDVANPDLGVRDVTSKAKADEPPPQKPPAEAPRSAPKEEGTTTPPKSTEAPEGGISAENGVVEPSAPVEPPKTPQTPPEKPVSAKKMRTMKHEKVIALPDSWQKYSELQSRLMRTGDKGGISVESPAGKQIKAEMERMDADGWGDLYRAKMEWAGSDKKTRGEQPPDTLEAFKEWQAAKTGGKPAETTPETPVAESTESAGAKTAEQEAKTRREAFRNDPVLQRIDAEYKKAKTDAERNALRDAFEARVKELQRKGLKVPKDAAPTEPPKEEPPKEEAPKEEAPKEEAPKADEREGKVSRAAEIIAEQVRKNTGDKKVTADKVRRSAETLVKAIEDKNVDALRSRFNGLNQGSVKAFEELTGLKMPKTQKGQHEVVDRFCGITPEERARIDGERAAKRKEEAERRRTDQSLKDGEEAVKSMRVELQDGKVVTADELVRQGWTVEKAKRGAANYLRIRRPDGGGFYRFNETTAYDYLKKLEADAKAKSEAPKEAETPSSASDAKPAKAEAEAESPKPSYSPSNELVEAKTRIEAMPTDSDKQRSAKKKAQKDWLLSSVDEAINSHGNADVEGFIKEYISLLRRRNATWEKSKAEKLDEQIEKERERFRSDEMITFDVPDDGTFKVYNTPEALALFKRNIQKRLSPTSLKEGTISKAEKPLAEDIKEAGVGMKVGEAAEPTGKGPGRVEARTPEEEIEERLDLRRLDPKRRSDPKVLEWAKKNKRTVTDGMATPDAVRAYDEAMTEAAAKVVNKRWFPDMKIVTHKYGEKIKRGQHVLDRLVDDEGIIKAFENEDGTITVYRAVQVNEKGEVRPPQSTRVQESDGKIVDRPAEGYVDKDGNIRSASGGAVVIKAEERPDLAHRVKNRDGTWKKVTERDVKDGRYPPEMLGADKWFFDLKKAKGTGSTDNVVYDPYMHSSDTPLNDQFTSAWKRPDWRIAVSRILKSDLESGYRADKAGLSVGAHEWKGGAVDNQLPKNMKRKVFLTQHLKMERILPEAEAAKILKEKWGEMGLKLEIPDSRVSPAMREALIKEGFNVVKTGDVQYLRDTAGRALGWFDPQSKEVHLLPGADPQTVAHEIMWHGTRQYMTERAAKGDAKAQKFLDMMHDVEKNAPQDIKDIVNRLYMRGGVPVDRDTLLNEYGAWFTMKRGGYALEKAMQKAENRNWFAKGLHAVKEMFKDFLIRHGGNRVDISEVDGMTRDEFVDFLADQFARGKTLGNIKEDKPALSTKETRFQKWRRKTYDQNAAVRDLERDVEKLTGRKIAEADNVEMANALKYGLKEAANMDIQGRMRSLREKLHDGGIHFADLEYYAACKAAAGRDAKIDKRNLDKLEADMKAQGATPDEIDAAKAAYRSSNGSHIDPREARRVVAEIESGSQAQAYKDALAELRKTIDETLQTQVDAGLVSKAAADQWRAEEPDYVPFKNEYDPENGGWNGRGSSMSNFVAPEHRMAKGRQSAAGDIIAHVFMDHQAARHRAIENAVRQKLAKLVKAHPELGTVEKLKADAVKNVEQSDPNVVIFKQGGDSYAIRLEGTRGAAVVNAFTGRETLDMKWADKGFSVYGKKISFRNFTRWSAGMATRYSPTFALRNTLKDNIELANIVYSERGPLAGSAWMGKYVANRAKMAKTLAKYVATGKIDTASAEGAILDRYIKAGGLIAGGTRSEAFSSIKDRLDPKAIEKEVRRGKSKVAAAARHTLNSIAYLNEYAEMATRVGVFATEVKGGKSDAEAALFSRRATVDFNRHGDWTPGFNLVRMFSNSTLGATARAAAALGKSKYGMVATGMMFANGLAQALIEHYANADEDKERAKRGEATGKDVSEFDRRTSLFYFRSGDKLYRVAQHESPFSLVKYAGDCVGRWLCGEISGKQMAKNLGVNAAEIAYNFLPMGSINLTSRKDNLTEDFKAAIVSGIVPSALQPIAEIAFDMDFKGDPVTKKLFDDFASRSHNGKSHTPSWAKATAEWIQEHTGGNAGNHKGLDVAPEVIQKLVEGYGKNLLKDVSTAFSVGEAIVKNDYSGLDPRNTPVKRDFVRPLDGNTQRYYSAMGNYKGDRKELLAMIPNWTAEERKAFVKEHPWAAAPEVDKMIQKIGELQKLEDGYKKADKRGKWVKAKEPPTEEQKEKWKAARLRYQAKFLEIAEKHGGEH